MSKEHKPDRYWLDIKEARIVLDGKWIEYKDYEWHAKLLKTAGGVLVNLLAVVHRDGGHYTAKVGLEQSVKDAMEKISNLLGAGDELKAAKDVANEMQHQRDKWFFEVGDLEVALKIAEARLNWLDAHTAFVADGEYVIGPYKEGELRKMADDGIAIDKAAEVSCTEYDKNTGD